MKALASLPLRVLVRPSVTAGHWVAVCVDRYMVAQGSAPDEAVRALKVVLRSELAKGFNVEPLEHLPPAPDEYVREFEEDGVCPPPQRPRTESAGVRVNINNRMAVPSRAMATVP